MTTADVHGPIDFVLIEFSENRLTGGAAQALLDLVDKGIVALYDVMVVGKENDGSVYALDPADGVDQPVASPTSPGSGLGCSPRRTCAKRQERCSHAPSPC